MRTLKLLFVHELLDPNTSFELHSVPRPGDTLQLPGKVDGEFILFEMPSGPLTWRFSRIHGEQLQTVVEVRLGEPFFRS